MENRIVSVLSDAPCIAWCWRRSALCCPLPAGAAHWAGSTRHSRWSGALRHAANSALSKTSHAAHANQIAEQLQTTKWL